MHDHPAIDIELGTQLRDQFFALSTGTHAEAAKQRFVERVAAVEVAAQLELDGLGLSFHPSARFRALRFVEAERIDASLRHLFARPAARMPELAAVFVDPEEFSYRSFENILPLDRYFAGLELELALTQREKLNPGRVAQALGFTLECPDATRAALLGLDGLDLYLEPLNAASRGGRRYIFHSTRLAKALEGALRAALPKRWLTGFAHVNPVFRCNRFEPGDAKFARHVDTPYYDAGREQVSRYTLLIYLTGGSTGDDATPALQIGDDISLAQIDAMRCVVFDQQQPHEGAAFEHGRKVFLRTELIFNGKAMDAALEDRPLEHRPWIAELFAKACYWTGESVFEPQLARHTHALYDRAAAAHWGGEQAPDPDAPEPYVHKQFRGLDFITNGVEFWFPKRECLPLEQCAALALLDVLNCKIGGQAFHKLCTREVLDSKEPPSTWIPARLQEYAKQAHEAEPLMTELELELLFPPSEAVDPAICCPFHHYQGWDPTRNDDTVELFERAQRFAKRRIASAPIQIMGEEVFLDPRKFVVEHGKIHVLSERALAPVNFAACWNDGSTPGNYLDVEVMVDAPILLVPPILYVEHEHGYRLLLDFFRNGWMVSHERRRVPVPKFRGLTMADYESGDYETTPWIDAAEAEVDDLQDEDDDDGDGTWWSDSPLVQALYADDGED